MTTAEYWETIKHLPQRTTETGWQVVNWAPRIRPNYVGDQYEWVVGWNPIDERWEPKPPKAPGG